MSGREIVGFELSYCPCIKTHFIRRSENDLLSVRSPNYRVVLIRLYHGGCHGSGGVHKVHVVSSSLLAGRYIPDVVRIETSKRFGVGGVHGLKLVAIEDRCLRASLGYGVSSISINISCANRCGVR